MKKMKRKRRMKRMKRIERKKLIIKMRMTKTIKSCMILHNNNPMK